MSVAVFQVALALPLPHSFDYLPPAGTQVCEAAIGCRVRAPLGTRELVGVIVGVGTAEHTPQLRALHEVLDQQPLFHGELLQSLRWLAHYLHAPLGEVLATALPAALRGGEPLAASHAWAWQLTEAGRTALSGMRAGKPRQLAELLQSAALDEDALDLHVHAGWRSTARGLDKRGLTQRIAIPASQLAPAPQPGPTLNDEQESAVAAISAEQTGFAPLLLDGVTGSGKTEVYLQAIAACLTRGKQALVLVPEIGLTPQMLARFRTRLGVPVHALHSGLNDGERARVWAAAWRGEARVIVGTRSAVFTPLPNAGLIVVDEEHDTSYKQFDGIRYHARDFALVRGKALQVPVVLGSATPSLESLHNAGSRHAGGEHAGSRRFAHLRLTRRAGAALPPAVRVIDVRKRALQAGLSLQLLDAIDAALADGGQVLVFKNRRGYAPVLLCHDCGWSAQCQRCDSASTGMAMTVHGGGRRLQCHHCGARRPAPPACPDCGGLALQPQGIGTERLEELLAARYPDVPVLRADRGSTRHRDALSALLAKLGDRPGILVGTQMLAKGHDLAHLTLVAVVGIDEGLFSADFRSQEKLAQLLIQVAGRAGRADKPGQVLLQTHHPEHPLLLTLVHGGYHAFAEAELAQRQAASFPPFAHLALLRAEAKQLDATNSFLVAAKLALRAAAPKAARAALDLHGPLPAPMPRRAGYQRSQLLLSSNDRSLLHSALDAALSAIHALPDARRVRWSLDIDPVDLY